VLRDNPDKVPGDVKAEVEAALADLNQKVGQAMYARTQSSAAGADAGTSGARQGADEQEEEVVDAEIVDQDKPRGDTR
jgi:molecular chaperone DnaK